MGWPSWRTRSTSWRPSLLAPRLAPERPPRLTSELSASARSWSSPPARTRRTRTGRPTWPPSCSPRSRSTSSRSRRPRRSPPSTWPSSGRPSRRWRSAPSLPPSFKPCQIRAQDDQLKLEENLPSWKLHLNPICEDPEVGQKLSELLLCFPKTLHVTLNLFLKSYLVLRNPNFCFVTYNKYQSLK